MGAHRLLIYDGHESHNSVEFQTPCQDGKIITLCMPLHSSHLLRPLDVGCFSPLKRAYGQEIGHLKRDRIAHTTKLQFFSTFKAAYNKSITRQNIYESFRDAVILKLDIKLRALTPPPILHAEWESRTLSNVRELGSQSTLIRDRISSYQNSSPTSIIASLNQLTKGAQIAGPMCAHRVQDTVHCFGFRSRRAR